MKQAIGGTIIPWDFSQVAGYALRHAVKITKTTENPITLLHIAYEENDFRSKEELKEIKDSATKSLVEICDNTEKQYGVRPNMVVREGNIFTTINNVADESGANLIIMGTHGMAGMQRITGSFALKVIAGSVVPFLVVQAPPKKEMFANVVCPVDSKKETNIKLIWAKYLHDHFNSRIHIVRNKTDDEFIGKKVEMHYRAAQRFMEDNNITHEMVEIDKAGNLSLETIKYVVDKNADIILIMVTKGIAATDYILGASEQQLIANDEQIPVMCINAQTETSRYIHNKK